MTIEDAERFNFSLPTSLAALAREPNKKTSYHPQGTRHALQGNFARLQQVFWNLLKNAAKFTSTGGEIHLRTRAVGTEGIKVEVTDTGYWHGGRHVRKSVPAF